MIVACLDRPPLIAPPSKKTSIKSWLPDKFLDSIQSIFVFIIPKSKACEMDLLRLDFKV